MIVALGREKNVGKDQFAMFIVEYLRDKFRNLQIDKEGFADRLYDFCYAMYSWAGFRHKIYYINKPKAKEEVLPAIGKTPRQLLLNIGEKVREYDPEIFSNALYKSTRGHLKIVTDMRNPEEMIAGLKQQDVYCVRIIGGYSGYTPKDYGAEDIDNHLAPYDHLWHEVIHNDGTLNDLRNKAIEFAERVIVPKIRERLRGTNG